MPTEPKRPPSPADSYERRFRYHASAVAFGARVEGPAVLDARAAVALPSIGGRVTASASGYLMDAGFIRFEMAGSEVIGDVGTEAGQAFWRTRASTWIKGFKVIYEGLEIVRIDDLRVTLESRCRHAHSPQGQLAFRPLSVEHTGFQICGEACAQDTTPELAWIDRPTFADITRAARDKGSRTVLTRGGTEAKVEPKRIYGVGACMGAVRGGRQLRTLADSEPTDELMVFGISAPREGTTRTARTRDARWEGWSVTPSLGGLIAMRRQGPWFRFYFGETAVAEGRRRFTALRMVFERSPRSDAVVGEVEINGCEHP